MQHASLLLWNGFEEVAGTIELSFCRPSLRTVGKADLPPQIGAISYGRTNGTADDFNLRIRGIGLKNRSTNGCIVPHIQSLDHAG